MASPSSAQPKVARQRVPAAERRDALVGAAIHEFAAGGYHGTPVDRIARAVGVAQPYVFSLFGSKRELFLAAVDRGHQLVGELMTKAAAEAPDRTCLEQYMGDAYVGAMSTDRDLLMLQLQSYAACDDPVIRERVRENFTRLARLVRELLGPEVEPETLANFFRYGMLINVSAAMGIESMVGGGWLDEAIDPHR